MKNIMVIALFSLTACGRESSPEGRLQIQIEEMQQKFDSLKNQNNAILDSISSIKQELRLLKLK